MGGHDRRFFFVGALCARLRVCRCAYASLEFVLEMEPVPATVDVKAKWARPWFPRWKPGETECVCLLQRSFHIEDAMRVYKAPKVDSPEFWKIVPEDIKDKFDIGYSCGKDIIRVPWEHRKAVMRIFAALLGLGYVLSIQTRLCFNMGPEDLPMDPVLVRPVHELTSAMLERAAVKRYREYVQQLGMDAMVSMSDVMLRPYYIWLKESAWFTEEGKSFVRELRSNQQLLWKIRTSLGNETDSEEERIELDAVQDGDVFVAAAPPVIPVVACRASPTPVSAPKRAKLDTVKVVEIPDDDDEEYMCMICEAEPPTTIVHPCLCCVVCATCSKKLKATADKDRCVKCRRLIEFVDE